MFAQGRHGSVISHFHHVVTMTILVRWKFELNCAKRLPGMSDTRPLPRRFKHCFPCSQTSIESSRCSCRMRMDSIWLRCLTVFACIPQTWTSAPFYIQNADWLTTTKFDIISNYEVRHCERPTLHNAELQRASVVCIWKVCRCKQLMPQKPRLDSNGLAISAPK